MRVKINCFIIFFVCLFSFPFIVSAQCNYEREAELSRIASNVQFSYNYVFEDDYPVFTVNITNLTNDIYIVDNSGNIMDSAVEFNIPYRYKNKVKYDIYSKDGNCLNEKIVTTYVNFPLFNTFSKTEECKKNPNFSLCAVWANTTAYTKQDFDKLLKKYEQQMTNQEIGDNESGIFNEIIQWLIGNGKYYCLIFVIIFLVIVFVKKVKK